MTTTDQATGVVKGPEPLKTLRTYRAVYVHTHALPHTRMHARTQIHPHAYLHTRTNTSHARFHGHTDKHTHADKHARILTYMHAYTHTRTSTSHARFPIHAHKHTRTRTHACACMEFMRHRYMLALRRSNSHHYNILSRKNDVFFCEYVINKTTEGFVSVGDQVQVHSLRAEKHAVWKK